MNEDDYEPFYPYSKLTEIHFHETLAVVSNLSKIIEEYDKAYLELEPVYLPETTKTKVLIFDIDETMVHSIDERDPKGMKGKIHLLIPDQRDAHKMVPVCLNVRPHLMKCLYTLKDKF